MFEVQGSVMKGLVLVGQSVLTDKEYLGITVPFMLSTMTQPLMGAVNTALMGQLSDPKYIAAVALGAILFNNIYWFFGFLRVSTSGYAAQALGSGSKEESFVGIFKAAFYCYDCRLQLYYFTATYFDSLYCAGCSGRRCSGAVLCLL